MFRHKLEVASVTAVGGAANVVTTGAILAAVGLQRYRIWSFNGGTSDTNDVATRWKLELVNPAATVIYAIIASGSFGWGQVLFPGGMRWTTNLAVNWRFQSTVAAVDFRAIVHYTVEGAA